VPGVATRGPASLVQVFARIRRGVSWRWLAGFLALVGVANVVVLVAQAHALIRSLYLSADNASGLVLPALASHAPAGSVVNLGNHPWYEAWWLMRATASLPGYRGLWEVAPFLFGLLGIAVVAACAWWGLGRLAALLSAVVLLATSEAERAILYVPDSHGPTVLHAGLLGGSLLLVYRRSLVGRITPRFLLLVGLPLVAFTGLGLTDQLLFVNGLAPFVLAPLLCWWRLRSKAWRTVSAFAIAVGVLSALLALLLSHVAQDQHVVHARFPIEFVASEALVANLQNSIAAFVALGGGDFFGASASGGNLFVFVTGVLVLVALVATLSLLWRWCRSLAGTAGPIREERPQTGPRELFIAFWGSSLVLVLAAFALTSASNTASDARYLIGAWVALAALVGVFSTTPLARVAVIAAVAVFGLLNIRGELSAGVQPGGVAPNQTVAGAIERFAAANGASVGYSGYWDASPVTWETHLRVKIYPIQACDLPGGWCQFFGIEISSWYVPRSHARTFLLTDTRPGVPLAVAAPPASFGKPIAAETVGEGLTVYIYDHDIAADLSP
jgi:hypothetical protein